MTTRVYKIVMTPEDTNDRVAYMIDRTDESPVTEDTALVTEDNRIPEIRAVLDEYVRPDDLDALHAVRRRIRVILDSDACNCQAIPGTENYPGPWHVRGDAPHYPCANPAPRAWFPGGTVPAGRTVQNVFGETVLLVDDIDCATATLVEVAVLTRQEWQAAVDRARATAKRCRCGVRRGTEHMRNCLERCQDCGGDPDGLLEQVAVGHRVQLAVAGQWLSHAVEKLGDVPGADYLEALAEWLTGNAEGDEPEPAHDTADVVTERDALLPRLAELTEQAGKLRTTEWIRTCARLPIEEWPPAPAYKGPMVPAAELDGLLTRTAELEASIGYHTTRLGEAVAERQARIDRAVELIDAGTATGPHFLDPDETRAVRAALAGDQPGSEAPGD